MELQKCRESVVMFDLNNKKVWVAGHNGFVGQSLLNGLKRFDSELITAARSELDLTNSEDVDAWIGDNGIDVVFLAAAKVGGIEANRSYPVEFLLDNLKISTNIIHSSYKHNVSRLVNLGSSCFYPRMSPQPITEDSLLTLPLEPTNEGYALAKITAAKLCEFYNKQYNKQYITLVPTNLYGPGDHYDTLRSHVIPSMIMKFHNAIEQGLESLTFWGTGEPIREFLFVDDAVEGIIFAAQNLNEETLVNVSGGHVVSIKQLANVIALASGFKGEIDFDISKPDGMPKKVLCNRRLTSYGWSARTDFSQGIKKTIDDFRSRKLGCLSGGL